MVKYLLALLCAFICMSCGDNFYGHDNLHRVADIADGNTLVLSSGIKVKLCGVSATEESAVWLKEQMRGKAGPYIWLRMDRKMPVKPQGKGSEIWAYAFMPAEKRSLNAVLLMTCKAPLLANAYLADSLYSFGNLASACKPAAQGNTDNADDEPAVPGLAGNNSGTGDYENGGQSETPASPVEKIIARAKLSTFFVINSNAQSEGSAFLIGPGLAISNYHVFEGGNLWLLRSENGKEYKVTKADIIKAMPMWTLCSSK
ncbi:MAG: hypothetical protein V4543_15625 [Bacteroidota bacterium]